jgi:hypothetical protein
VYVGKGGNGRVWDRDGDGRCVNTVKAKAIEKQEAGGSEGVMKTLKGMFKTARDGPRHGFIVCG